MMKDFYAILHVLPSAEIDVIKAAYRALSRKYHPDTCEEKYKSTAKQKMQEINEAFGVIGDPDKRREYDAERKAANQEDEFASNGEENDAQLEADWAVACKYCPDALSSFAHLNNLSRSLAFAFKSYLLDSKQFSQCWTIAEKFKADFLKNYFGSDPAIQEIGEKLVLAGELPAAKSVNRAVKVMGTALKANYLIQTLILDYPHLKQILARQPSKAKRLFSEIMEDRHVWSTFGELLHSLNIPYDISLFGGRFIITYKGKHSEVAAKHMRSWIKANLSNHPEIIDL